MKQNHKIIFGVLFLLSLSGCQTIPLSKSKEDHVKPLIKKSWSAVIAYAEQHLPGEGTLLQKPGGYAYVKVDDRYINDLFPLLKAEGYQKPPYFRRKDAPGAHISVIYENENVQPKEIGKRFSFTLKDIVAIDNDFIVLQVAAPELEELRKRYGLGPKLQNHEFHITLAVKIPSR